jgi:GTP-binding protein
MDNSFLEIKTAEFVKSAVKSAHYPPEDFPEMAFAGRSNVGKSSLINCLLKRKKLVRTSQTPGRTQTINFFIINGQFYFVDLPGYGYAKVSASVRAQWRPMMEGYLKNRQTLRGVVHILDSRHTPTPDDIQFWRWLNHQGIPSIPVLTKIDKLKRSQWDAQATLAAQSLSLYKEQIILFSSTTGLGREALLEKIVEKLELHDSKE